MNRRKFLALTGAALGACGLTCVGLGVIPSDDYRPEQPLPVGFPVLTLGDQALAKRILVAYASAAGSTGGVAETIAKTLAEGGAAVDVMPVQSVAALDGYDALVLGSAIQGGKWLPAAADFLQTNHERLRQMPTAFFLVCLMQANPARRDLVDQFLEPQRSLVEPVAEGRFVGAFFTQKLSFLEKIGMRFFTAYCGLGLRAGDFRDPEVIRSWAVSLRPLLLA